MTALLLYLRVVRLWWALGVVAIGTAWSAVSVALIPDTWIYSYVPSIAPGVFGCGMTAVLAAASLALPRIEAMEVTASRALWRHRLGLALGVYAVVTLLAAAVCLAAGSFAFFLLPLIRGGIAVAAATFLAAVFVPTRWVAPVALAYVIACHHISGGDQWWDLLLRHATPFNLTAAIALCVLGTAVFAHRGARPLPPEDEY